MGQGVGVGSPPQFHLQTSSPHAPQRACILDWNGISFTSGGGYKNMKRFSSCRWTPQTKQKHFSVFSFDVRGKKSSIWNHNVGQRFPHQFQTLCHLNKNFFYVPVSPMQSGIVIKISYAVTSTSTGGVTERTVIARSSDLLQTQRVFGNEKVWELRRLRECKISTHSLSVTATALVL